ncbi:GTP pyrophosphokinase family protein [Chitinophaga sp. RCC_12]|uniref:GTP pyrophosphokinase n=1 Tax=Chitinophaga sp. RCC_12 TaxID=3239226 RepID=UPI0035260D23
MDYIALNKLFEEQYQKNEIGYKAFLKEFKRTVEHIISVEGIPLAFEISARLKSLDSIKDKHESTRYRIKESILELNDLVGIRIVVVFPEDREKVISIIKDEFDDKTTIKSRRRDYDKFGYNSVHLIVGVKKEWLATPDWRDHGEKRIEIQVRTLAEHIWAETSHTLFYKNEESIPDTIKRDLSRLSALLEVVDEKLQNLKKSVFDHFNYIRTCDYPEILNMDFNPETFRRMVNENSKGKLSFEDSQNQIISTRIERNYNIIKAGLFDEIIKSGQQSSSRDLDLDFIFEMLDSWKEKSNEKG